MPGHNFLLGTKVTVTISGLPLPFSLERDIQEVTSPNAPSARALNITIDNTDDARDQIELREGQARSCRSAGSGS